jgi:outer membrane protein insertion porin family
MVRQPVVSAGLGLVYRHSIVRAELNVGVPVAASSTDGYKKGMQFGIGLSFL